MRDSMRLWLQCSIGEDMFLQDIEGVDKIVAVGALKREGTRRASQIGSVILRGIPIPVFDVRHLLWQEESSWYLNSRILVAHSKSEAPCGFLFEKVLDLFRFSVDQSATEFGGDLRRSVVKGAVHRVMDFNSLGKLILQRGQL